jgi:hypothetical protein
VTETPEQRLARWAQRDAVVGLDAEVRQLRAALADRDGQVATSRERSEQLANRITQLEIERDALRQRVATSERPALTRRVYRRARSAAARVLPH